VFDGEREVGRVYLVDSYGDRETWFWGRELPIDRS
jgi:hypothetical protein